MRSEILAVDRFGNLELAATKADLAGGRTPTRIDGRPTRHGATFGDVAPGELVVYVDSVGHVAVAVNGGSAAAELGVAAKDVISLSSPKDDR